MPTRRIDDIETNRGLQAAEIAAQNDLFRKGLVDADAAIKAAGEGIQGRILLTPGVIGRGGAFQVLVLETIAKFDDFNADNDPYGDHSFAAVTVEGVRLFWKIDLHDTAYHYGSDRPWDPAFTCRVLTIMEPSEY